VGYLYPRLNNLQVSLLAKLEITRWCSDTTIFLNATLNSDFFHNVVISERGLVPNTRVEIPAGGALPPDGRWIEDGIRHKLRRYGGEGAVRGIALIIGVAGFVDDEQVAAFQRAFCEADLPFAEIYINTPFHGTICLKAREAAPGALG
jgi:hypothetical protein